MLAAYDEPTYTTADVLERMPRFGRESDWVRGPNQFPLPPRDPGSIRNMPEHPYDRFAERVAEGISPVGNTFTPLREAYEAVRGGSPSAIAEAMVPLAAM